MLAVFVPIVVFLICQIRVRSFWDVNNATIGLLYSLIGAAVFQVFVKWLIGGLRPHFLAVCRPAVGLVGPGQGKGFEEIYYQPDVCTGDKREINDALQSMPSGHTTAAFAGFIFLYLYLNAKLKVFANYHPAMWKLIAVYAPVLGAVLIGGALTIDEFHHWYDIVAGAIIGTVFAFSSYRMTYAAIWDWRYNHIPLNRTSPFMYGHDGGDLANAVWTRKAGFGGHAGGSSHKDVFGKRHQHHDETHLDSHSGAHLGNNGAHMGSHNGVHMDHHDGTLTDHLHDPHMGHQSDHFNGGYNEGHPRYSNSIPRRPVGAHPAHSDDIV